VVTVVRREGLVLFEQRRFRVGRLGRRDSVEWPVTSESTSWTMSSRRPAVVPAGYSARVPEDLPPGAVVTWVQGHDPDLGLGGQVRYSLVDNFNGTFEVSLLLPLGKEIILLGLKKGVS